MNKLHEWNRIVLRAIILSIALAGTVSLTTGCVFDDDSAAEEAEDAIEEGAEDVEDAVDDVEDEIEDDMD